MKILNYQLFLFKQNRQSCFFERCRNEIIDQKSVSFQKRFKRNSAFIQLAVENFASEHLLGNTFISYNFAFENLLLLYDASKNNFLRLCNKNIFIDSHIFTFAIIVLKINHFINDKTRYAIQFFSSFFETHCFEKIKIKFTDFPKNVFILTMSDILNVFIKSFCEYANFN